MPISPPVIPTLNYVTKPKNAFWAKNRTYCESCHLAACLPDACRLYTLACHLSPVCLSACRLTACSLPNRPPAAYLPGVCLPACRLLSLFLSSVLSRLRSCRPSSRCLSISPPAILTPVSLSPAPCMPPTCLLPALLLPACLSSRLAPHLI